MNNTEFAMAFVFVLTALGARAIYVSKMVELRGKLWTQLGDSERTTKVLQDVGLL